jgi:hypothetical protein
LNCVHLGGSPATCLQAMLHGPCSMHHPRHQAWIREGTSAVPTARLASAKMPRCQDAKMLSCHPALPQCQIVPSHLPGDDHGTLFRDQDLPPCEAHHQNRIPALTLGCPRWPVLSRISMRQKSAAFGCLRPLPTRPRPAIPPLCRKLHPFACLSLVHGWVTRPCTMYCLVHLPFGTGACSWSSAGLQLVCRKPRTRQTGGN